MMMTMINMVLLMMMMMETQMVLLSPKVQFSQESLDQSDTGIPGNTVLGGGANQQPQSYRGFAVLKCLCV